MYRIIVVARPFIIVTDENGKRIKRYLSDTSGFVKGALLTSEQWDAVRRSVESENV